MAVTRAVWWLPGLAVALGAAVATAHGLFEVAAAARVPGGIAWLYPLITDGLALVAYTATARLSGSAARYAWSVVVTAAGLSGLAQAVYLAGGATLDAPPVLRFGVGAWPAIAAAVVAHLLYLLAAEPDPAPTESTERREPAEPDAEERSTGAVQPVIVRPVQPAPYDPYSVQPYSVQPVQPAPFNPDPAPSYDEPERPREDDPAAGVERPFGPGARAGSPATERARAVALRLARTTGAWPTVTVLEAEAGVGRGTAAAVLKPLRAQQPGLHLITNATSDEQRHEPTETDENTGEKDQT